MAVKQWYSLRTNEILKKLKSDTRLHDFMWTSIRLMPDHGGTQANGKPKMGMIGDKNSNVNHPGNNPFHIKVTEKNWNYFNSNTSPFLHAAHDIKISADRKNATFKIPVDPKANKPRFVNIRMRKSGRVEESKAGTAEQERGSALIFRRALNENAAWDSWEDIVEDDKTFPQLVDIFGGDVPQSWLESYFAQQHVLLEQVKPARFSEFNRDGGFMDYISNYIKRKFDIKQKDTWNPADIWVVRGPHQVLVNKIEDTAKGPKGTQTIHELNATLRGMYKDKMVMGISLKKTGRTAYYEEVNMDGFIPDTKNYNYDVKKSDFEAKFAIVKDGMFTQDVLIKVDAQAKESKDFTFQIKANSSDSTTGSNLKFEPTAKGASLARLGKAPVDLVVKLLKDMKGNAVFVNDYNLYPKNLFQFNDNYKGKGKRYFETIVLPDLLGDMTSDETTVEKVLEAISTSYGSPKDRTTNTRCKLMGLDFFYQVFKLSDEERNEFVTDMVFLAQKKAFKKMDQFGPFGKIY